jgi:hypothetical protein
MDDAKNNYCFTRTTQIWYASNVYVSLASLRAPLGDGSPSGA